MRQAGTLWELIRMRADASPDARLAVDEHGEELTFGGYRRAVGQVAAAFHARGLRAGDVVSWQLPTTLESFVLAGALSRLGVVQNPILTIYREREVGFVIRQARSRLLLVPPEYRGFDFATFAQQVTAGTGTEVLLVDGPLPRADGELPAPPAATPPPDAPVRWLFATSGTTAEPKVARHTDHTIIATARGMVARLELAAEDRNALCFPFAHIAGPIWLASSLLVGTSQIVAATFDPVTTPALLQREDVTLAGSGTIFHLAYLEAQRRQPGTPLFPRVRVFPGGGAPKPPQLHFDLKAELGGIGIASGWGLTEAPILTLSSVRDDDAALAQTEGSAMPGVRLRVVTLDGREAAPGEEGELRAKAPQMMRGYLDPTLDAEAFDADRWFATGDLGRIDGRGNVTITGRLKDIIIRKGENISAKELEDALFSHPAIADVAVIGLPDAEAGERCCAVIVPAAEVTPPTLEALAAFLGEHGLACQKWPEQLEVVAALPRNPTGKVLKRDLQARYRDPAPA